MVIFHSLRKGYGMRYKCLSNEYIDMNTLNSIFPKISFKSSVLLLPENLKVEYEPIIIIPYI